MKANVKKVFSVVLSLVLLVGGVIAWNANRNVVFAASQLGDVDGDGSVTAADARLALRASVNLEHYELGSREFIAADYDRDGTITAGDARMILRTAVDLEPAVYLEDENEPTPPDEPTSRNESTTNTNPDPIYPSVPSLDDALEIVGGKYSPERAGLYYYLGHRIEYDDIPEGAEYTYYDENGVRGTYDKPYSPGNEPPTVDYDHCEICGKPIYTDRERLGCWYGGCDRFAIDMNCPECGEFVPAWTCHTCKH